MPTPVLMPALSPTMTEGTLAKWLKREGDEVAAGDVIAEIETDKATMEVEATDEGRLAKILVPEGTEGVAINTPIALLLGEDEDESALAEAAPAPEPKAEAKPPKPSEAKPPKAPEATPTPSAAEKRPSAEAKEGRVFASPLARRMAAQAGLDLAALAGSGPHGRVVKRDVEKALAAATAPAAGRAAPVAAAPPPAAPAGTPAPPTELMPAYREVPLSAMRKIIAQRLSDSKREAPHHYLTIDCRIDRLLAIRAELNGRSPKEGEGAYKLSLNDFIVRAAALALRQVPAANAAWAETAIRLYERADVAVAVAVPDGLVTPVVRGADAKGLAEISREMKDFAARARAGKLMPEDYQGGTFTVSNLGMYGIRQFAAVINPPQGCILAVGAGEQRPVVEGGALAVATVMTCTLSCDHRVVDGAIGAAFLAAFKRLIEDPLSMLL